MGAMVLSKAIEGFLLSRTAEGYSQETLKIYRWALSIMVGYLKDPPVKSVTPADLQSFYAYLQTDYIPHRTNGDTSPLKPRSIENAWTKEKAIAYIRGQAGTHFDPRVVRVFLEMLENG